MELPFTKYITQHRSRNFLSVINPLNFFRLSLSLQIVLSILVGVALGVMFIYSSSINSEGISVTNEYKKQIILYK